jgi:mono/diheme cytochrome c family protein
MMTFLKWAAIFLGVIVLLIVGGVVAFFLRTNGMLASTYDVDPAPVAILDDSASLSRGAHLAVIMGCEDCHGENLGGKPFIEEPVMAVIFATNLTSGQGGIGASHGDADMVRSIRHGVRADGTSVWFMPSHDYWYLSDADLGAVIAHVRSMPPVDNTGPVREIGPIGRLLLVSGQIPAFLPAAGIEHEAPRPTAPREAVTAAYGEYLARPCSGCHQPEFSGGMMPGAMPDAPLVPNLTPTGNLRNWSEAEFITALRTGTTPEGRQLNAEFMPISATMQMTDDEMRAVFLFLQSLPPRETPSMPVLTSGG